MALESCPLVWKTVNKERKPVLPPLPDGYHLANGYYQDSQAETIDHEADDEHPEPWTEEIPAVKLAFYDYQPIPAPPAPEPTPETATPAA